MLKSSTERHSCPVMWPTITGGSQAWKRVAQSNVHRFDWKKTKEKEGSDATVTQLAERVTQRLQQG